MQLGTDGIRLVQLPNRGGHVTRHNHENEAERLGYPQPPLSVPPAPYQSADYPGQQPHPQQPWPNTQTTTEAAKPARKSHRKLWIGLAVAALLGFGGCAVAVAAGGEAVNNEIQKSVQQDTTPGDGAMADVKLTKFSRDEFGYGVAKVTIKNSTDKVQNYIVTVAVENKAGDQLATIDAVVQSLQPGQTTVTTGQGLDEVPAGSTARVVEVLRTAS